MQIWPKSTIQNRKTRPYITTEQLGYENQWINASLVHFDKEISYQMQRYFEILEQLYVAGVHTLG